MTMGDYQVARERMVREQVFERGITARRVLRAMLAVPRHRFLGADIGPQAYSDHAFPIGHSQTMSQPYMVAYLVDKLVLEGGERLLEIGTGSGYQAAVVAMLTQNVYTVERIADLAEHAKMTLCELGIANVETMIGDGSLGWREKSPFDRILLTAAARQVPKRLLTQLREGGVLVGPVETESGQQEIVRLTRHGEQFHLERLGECTFVPLVRDGGEPANPSAVGRPEVP